MAATCEIEFDNSPSKVVYCEQNLKGAVVLNLKEEIFVPGVYLRIYGEANSKYISGKSVRKNHEEYLDEKIVCYGGREEKAHLEVGTHRFPFECHLTTLPTSVEEPFGNIRYTASIRFDEQWHEAPIHEEIFTIVKPLNLNSMPNLRIPRATELEKRISYCFCFPLCRSNNIELTAHIPQQGYTPGQTIDLELDVNNKTVEDVNEIKVKLVKVSRFPSGSGIFERQRPKTVNLQIVDRWSSSEEMRKYRIQLVVPPLPPSDEENSRVVKISYKLQVKVLVGVFYNKAKLDIPIVIGTYPIHSKQSEDEGSKAAPSLPEFDPPVYEISADVYPADVDKTLFLESLKEMFIPKYPVFRPATRF